ncbi:hypothetical protein HDA40_001917 [Hamadaea flava]|uniref:DUF7674 domain-containing protein n=1 Tax=Hamadaea flava TaxID=1742688 RepID=A0ABV8LEW6_9ACTN|nr:hypothetical protein [Hamadaea flava]MCP2323410.1 hypothetical protein [Hamadaea flava]
MIGIDQFIAEMTCRFPGLQGEVDAHVENNDGLLAHVLFWDITSDVLVAFRGDDDGLSWRDALAFFDESYLRGDREVREVLVTSFLLNLPWPDQPGYEIVGHLGPVLAERFVAVRPNG